MTRTRTTTAIAVPRTRGLTMLAVLVLTSVIGVAIGLVITATAPIPGLPEPAVVVRVGIPVIRVVLDVAAVVTIGLSILPLLIGFDRPKLAEPVLASTRVVAMVSSLTWAVAALAALVVQAAELQPEGAVSFGVLADYVDTVGAGKALLFVAVFALISAGIGAWSVRAGEAVPAELRSAVALFALLPLPVTGHATNWRWHDFTMISMELHVMAAVAWTGGLGAVATLLATNRTLLAAALPQFSRLATICLVVVGITGLFNAFAELLVKPGGDVVATLWADLFGTSYGLIVVGKVLCFIALGVVGATIRWRLLPGIERHQPTTLIQWAALELGVFGLAFGLAVALTRAPVS